MPKCKVGDLAILVSGDNAGALVEVKRWIGAIPGLAFDGEDWWHCESLSSFKGASLDATRMLRGSPGQQVACRDMRLCPLEGNQEDLEREIRHLKELGHDTSNR